MSETLHSNRAEDLDVLRSGIEPLGDKMPLPHSMDPSDQDETIHFIAEIAIRRLLNRVHSSLYNPDTDAVMNMAAPPNAAWPGLGTTNTTLSLPRLLALSAELDRQLEQWYVSMPEGVRPPRGIEPIACERGRVLRLHYCAARAVIHRPFVLFAMTYLQQRQQGLADTRLSSSPSPGGGSHVPPGRLSTSASSTSGSPTPPVAGASASAPPLLPPIVAERCEVCVAACTTYLCNALEMLERRTPYMWSLAQNCMACLLVLMIAEDCGFGMATASASAAAHAAAGGGGGGGVMTAGAIASPPSLDILRGTVVARVRRWAVEGSSFEAEVAILERLAGKDGPGAAAGGGSSVSTSGMSSPSSSRRGGGRDTERRKA
jgi:hypothetical protein